MSSWDRQAAIERYEAMFSEAKDPDALMEELGTPTKVAVELANGYVSSPPPPDTPQGGGDTVPAPFPAGPEESAPLLQTDAEAAPPDTSAVEDAAPDDTDVLEPPETEEPEDAKQGGSAFLKLLYWVFAILVGIPVTVLLICFGIPFLSAGVWIIYTVIRSIPPVLGSFTLLSDILLLGGSGLISLAVGLFLSWFGLWLSIALCRLWIGKVLLSLGNRVMRGSGRTRSI